MNRIKELRKRKGVTQKEMGAAIDVSFYSISMYETEQRRPTPEVWAKMAAYFGVSVGYLMGFEDSPGTPAQIPDTGGESVLAGLTDENKEKARAFIEFLRMQQEQQ